MPTRPRSRLARRAPRRRRLPRRRRPRVRRRRRIPEEARRGRPAPRRSDRGAGRDRPCLARPRHDPPPAARRPGFGWINQRAGRLRRAAAAHQRVRWRGSPLARAGGRPVLDLLPQGRPVRPRALANAAARRHGPVEGRGEGSQAVAFRHRGRLANYSGTALDVAIDRTSASCARTRRRGPSLARCLGVRAGRLRVREHDRGRGTGGAGGEGAACSRSGSSACSAVAGDDDRRPLPAPAAGPARARRELGLLRQGPRRPSRGRDGVLFFSGDGRSAARSAWGRGARGPSSAATTPRATSHDRLASTKPEGAAST